MVCSNYILDSIYCSKLYTAVVWAVKVDRLLTTYPALLPHAGRCHVNHCWAEMGNTQHIAGLNWEISGKWSASGVAPDILLRSYITREIPGYIELKKQF